MRHSIQTSSPVIAVLTAISLCPSVASAGEKPVITSAQADAPRMAHAGLAGSPIDAKPWKPSPGMVKRTASCGEGECVGADGKCYPYHGGGTDGCGPADNTPKDNRVCGQGQCLASDGKCYPYHGGGTDGCGPSQPINGVGIKKKPRAGTILGQ